MDLRGSSSPSSMPLGTISIPAARQPVSGPVKRPELADLCSAPVPAGRERLSERLDPRQLIAVAEGGLLVMAVYVLIGAGTGLLAGSVVVGVLAGVVAGVCAVAAILLIRGCAVAGGTHSDPGYDEADRVASLR